MTYVVAYSENFRKTRGRRSNYPYLNMTRRSVQPMDITSRSRRIHSGLTIYQWTNSLAWSSSTIACNVINYQICIEERRKSSPSPRVFGKGKKKTLSILCNKNSPSQVMPNLIFETRGSIVVIDCCVIIARSQAQLIIMKTSHDSSSFFSSFPFFLFAFHLTCFAMTTNTWYH